MDRDPARLVKAKFSRTSSKTVSAFCFEYFTFATLRFHVLKFSLMRRVQGSWEGTGGGGGYRPFEKGTGLLGRSKSGNGGKCKEMSNLGF